MPETLSEETIKITTQGVMKAEADLDRLKGKTGSFHDTIKSVGLGLTQFAGNLQKIGRLAGMISFGGTAGLGIILHGGFKGTQEANALSQAWEQFTRVISDRFAPYVRMAALALQDATTWFGSLSEATRDSIAQWALIGTGIAGVVALVPALVMGFAGVVGVFAAIASPATLVVALIGSIILVATEMFNLFQTGGAKAANSLNTSNQSWLQSLIQGIGFVVKALAKFFNWIYERANEVSDNIAHMIARIGQYAGVLPVGTTQALLEDIARRKAAGPLIDVKGLDEFFKKAREKVPLLEANLGGLGDKIAKWAENLKIRAGQEGLHPDAKAAIESSQAGWERIQKGLMGIDTKIPEKQLNEQRKTNDGIQKLIDSVKGIGPAVV